MSFSLYAILLSSVLVTGFISGIFGMAGGMILIGILLHYFPPATALALHGFSQITSNFARVVLWRKYIQWRVLHGYLWGAIACVAFFTWMQIQFDLIFIYLFLGLLPFVAFILPTRWKLDITKPYVSFICGVTILASQLTAGVAGGFLDQFYVNSPLDRRQQVATKALTQVFSHFLKIVYFTALLHQPADWTYLTPLSAVLLIVFSVAGNFLATKPLEKMKQENFVRYSNYILMTMGAYYLFKAAQLAFFA